MGKSCSFHVQTIGRIKFLLFSEEFHLIAFLSFLLFVSKYKIPNYQFKQPILKAVIVDHKDKVLSVYLVGLPESLKGRY